MRKFVIKYTLYKRERLISPYPMPAPPRIEPPCGFPEKKLLNWSGTAMKTKKPDIFLGITMCLLVLAAVL